MIVHDDTLLDSIGVLALGALPAAEAQALAEHVATCDICRPEYAKLREAANFAGYQAELGPGTLDDVTSRRLRSNVMRAVRDDAARTKVAEATGSATTLPRGGRASWLAYGAAAAAIVIALLSTLDNAALRSQNDREAARIALLEMQANAQSTVAREATARARNLDARLAQITAPGSKHFSVRGGEVVASGGRVIIALHDLRALPKGKVYQAWTLAIGAKAVAPSVTFSPDASGVAVIELPESAANLAAVAVSVEPAGGSKAPTSKPAFVRPLS